MSHLPTCLTRAWHPVADRVSNTSDRDRWDWRITFAERVLLNAAVEAGTAMTAQRREADGTMVLLARATALAPRPAVVTDEARLPRQPSREVLDIRELSRAIREEAVARIQGTTVPRPAVVTDRA